MPTVFYRDASAFLDAAAPALERDPLSHTVIAVMAQRYDKRELPDWAWFAIIEIEGVEYLAIRTHPDEPHAGFCPPLPAAARTALITALHDRGETVPLWNGDLDTAMALSHEFSPNDELHVAIHTRLFELHEVIWPKPVHGTLRPAILEELHLCAAWQEQFWIDAETQGGRSPQDQPASPAQRERYRSQAEQQIEHGLLWLLEVDGTPVQMTGLTLPSHGVVRIGPVFTPQEHRGRGYASWVVATLSQRILDDGHRPCLYTDQANPISSMVYERIGFVRVADEGNIGIAKPLQTLTP